MFDKILSLLLIIGGATMAISGTIFSFKLDKGFWWVHIVFGTIVFFVGLLIFINATKRRMHEG